MVNLLFSIEKFFRRSQSIRDWPLFTNVIVGIFFSKNAKNHFGQNSKKKKLSEETLFFQDGHLINTKCAKKCFSKDLLFFEI